MKGIRVIWPGYGRGEVDEVEYFYGLDVYDLRPGNIPDYFSVPTFWPGHKGGTFVEYTVSTRFVTLSDGRRALKVVYDREHTEALAKAHGEYIHCGTNFVFLVLGRSSGRCRWVGDPPVKAGHPTWEAFDVSGGRPKPWKASLVLARDRLFRSMVLSADGHACVLTGEPTEAALDAAHLVPACKGWNDLASNGITLRCDLHRLFDSGLFTFSVKGVVRITDPGGVLSRFYLDLLGNLSLREGTLDRVKSTLSLEAFRSRKPPRP